MKTKRMETGALLTVTFLLICTFLSGTIPDPETPELAPHKENYRLDEWNKENGLPYYQIRAITQTNNGFLWIATNSQLLRFDGDSFVNTGADTGLDILNEKLSDIYVDKKGTLWIGCTWGLVAYPPKTEKFIEFPLNGGDDQPTPVPVSRIIEDRSGSPWIGTHFNYLCRIGDHGPVWYKAVKGLTCKTVSALCERKNGNICVGTPEGLFVRDTREGDFFRKISSDNPDGDVPVTPVTAITSLHEDRRGSLWIGTDHGLIRMKESDGVPNLYAMYTLYTTENGLSHNMVTKILEDRGGGLWTGTAGGLNRITEDPEGNLLFDKYLENIHILSLFEDKKQSLWIGTQNAGLKRLKNTTLVESPENDGGPFRFPTVIEKVSVLQADGILITHAVGTHPAPTPLFDDIDSLTVFFTVPVFTKPEDTRFHYRLEGYDNQWRELAPGKERRVIYPDLPTGEYTFKITAAAADGKRDEKETTFSFHVKQSFYRSIVFRVILLTLVMMCCTAGLFLLKERFLKQDEKKRK